jgi:hypothetical protein
MEKELTLWTVLIYDARATKYTVMARTYNGALELAEGLHFDTVASPDINKVVVIRLNKHVVSHVE